MGRLKTAKAVVESRITSVDFKKANMLQILNASRTGDATVSHSIFQISPKDESRVLAECEFKTVSRWAFERFTGAYELYDAHEATTFYRQISTTPLAASLWGHVFEAKVLNYISTRGCDFEIRGLTSPGITRWTCRGPIPRSNFLRELNFVRELTNSVRDKKDSLHLVPSVRNFTAVDSILYTRNEMLTFIQCTVGEKHGIAATGLDNLRSWLKIGTPLAPLRPSETRPWRLIFIVPPSQASTFKSQRLEGDDKGNWVGKVNQYVLGLDVLGN